MTAPSKRGPRSLFKRLLMKTDHHNKFFSRSEKYGAGVFWGKLMAYLAKSSEPKDSPQGESLVSFT